MKSQYSIGAGSALRRQLRACSDRTPFFSMAALLVAMHQPAFMTDSVAAGARPAFQAPFGCAQFWDASTYWGEKKHWPDADSIDLAQRGPNLVNYTKGEPVLASAAGTVLLSKIDGDGGYRIYVDHGNGWLTHYIHLERNEHGLMAVGRKVAAGEQLGRASNSGATAYHLHFTQLRDGEAVRSVFDNTAIQTHAGNTDSWGTWGSDRAETIKSYNCRDGAFMSWTNYGKNYFLRYHPSTGESTFLGIDGSNALYGIEPEWIGQRWSHFVPFHLETGGHPHALYYSHSTGKVEFRRLSSTGKGSTVVKSGNWWAGWTHIVPLKLNGQNHLLAYSSVHGYANIDDIHPDGGGSTKIYGTTWAKGATNIVPFRQGPNQYVMLYYGKNGKVQIWRINKYGRNITRRMEWQATWPQHWTHLKFISHEGANYLLSYNSEDRKASLRRLRYDVQGFNLTASMQWTKPWTSITPYSKNGKGFFVLYNARNGAIRNYKLRAGGSGIERLWGASWRKDFR